MRCEKVANAGQTVVSDDLAARLPGPLARRAVGESVGCCAASTTTCPRRTPAPPTPPAARPRRLRAGAPSASCSAIDAPGEHRQCAISFLSIDGTDDVLAARRPGRAVADARAPRHRRRRRGDRALGHAVPEQRQRRQRRRASCSPAACRRRPATTTSGSCARSARSSTSARDLDLRAGVNRGRIYSGFVGSSDPPRLHRRSATPSTSAPG